MLLLAGCGFGLYRSELPLRAQALPPQEQVQPAQEPAAAPVNDAQWLALLAGLEKDARSYRGEVGIYFKDLRTGRSWEYNSDGVFPSASLIKVPIMAAVMEKIELGGLALDTRLKLTQRDRVGGSGSLQWQRDGTPLTVAELLSRMITESDNTATRMLINHLGTDYLGGAFRQLALDRTNITQEGMSLSSGRPYRENFTTPREMASLLERIYAGELVSRGASEFMLEALKQNKSRSRLRKGLPPGWELGHKTGLLRRACHDVGIVFSPEGDYVLAVLTSKAQDYTSAKDFITKVAGLTYSYYRRNSEYAQGAAQPRPRAI